MVPPRLSWWCLINWSAVPQACWENSPAWNADECGDRGGAFREQLETRCGAGPTQIHFRWFVLSKIWLLFILNSSSHIINECFITLSMIQNSSSSYKPDSWPARPAHLSPSLDSQHASLLCVCVCVSIYSPPASSSSLLIPQKLPVCSGGIFEEWNWTPMGCG